MRVQFERVSTFGAEMSTRDGGLGIAFNRDELSVFVIHQLPAADATIGTNGAGYVRAIILRPQIERSLTHGFWAGSIGCSLNLANQRPA